MSFIAITTQGIFFYYKGAAVVIINRNRIIAIGAIIAIDTQQLPLMI